MTIADYKEITELAMPYIDRLLAVAFVAVLLWVCNRIPWVAFLKWISAPTMKSLIFVSAAFLSAQTILGQESSYKYWNPYLLEFLKFFVGTFGGGFLALKAYMIVPDKNKSDEPSNKT